MGGISGAGGIIIATNKDMANIEEINARIAAGEFSPTALLPFGIGSICIGGGPASRS